MRKITIKRIKRYLKRMYLKNDERYIKYKFKERFGYNLNLDNPKTYNEKINWIKARYYNPLYEKYSDKIEVREYIKEKGYGKLLNNIIKVYDSTDEINLDELPNKFVMKPSNSSGGVFVVKDKSKFDLEKAKVVLNKKLKDNLYITNREWQYKNLKPRIIVEDLIESKGDLSDFKFFCFDGKVDYIYVEKNATHPDFTIDFFDRDWNHLDVKRVGHDNYHDKIPKPKKLKEMIKIAEDLSSGFAHVRVDLYCEEDKILFGELTFTPASGRHPFLPLSEDVEIAKKIKNNKNE